MIVGNVVVASTVEWEYRQHYSAVNEDRQFELFALTYQIKENRVLAGSNEA